MTKEHLKVIMLKAYNDGHIELNEESCWGFDYTGKDEFLLSDGAAQYFGKLFSLIKYYDLINETGKELALELELSGNIFH